MSGVETAGAAIAVLGVVTGTYAKVQQAEAEASMHGAIAKAKMEEAKAAEDSAAAAEKAERRRVAHVIGKQRAVTGAAGVDLTAGSPLLQELDSTRQGEMGALNIRRTGQMISRGKQFEASLARFQRSMAKNRRDWAYVQGVTSLAGVGTNYAAGGYAPQGGGTVGGI
jgi:hypothetical protein